MLYAIAMGQIMNDGRYYTKRLRVALLHGVRNRQNVLNDANFTSKTLELNAEKTSFLYLHALFYLTSVK